MPALQKYNRIKAELAEAGRKNSELAEYMGMHVTTISDWCTNKNQPSIQDLYKIAKFLRINVRMLLVPSNLDHELSLAAEDELSATKSKTATKRKTKTARK